MHVLKKVGIATGLAASAALSLALALPAQADTGAVGGDVVGVGSDTLQNAANFVFDGAPGVTGGYNPGGNLNRAVNFDATGDANGRLPYDGTCGTPDSSGLGVFCNGTTNKDPNSLAGSIVLRAGTKPVLRPNGTGGGVKALAADSASGAGYEGLPKGSIQFARMSRLPNSTEIGLCQTSSACGGLHIYRAANDTLGLAHVSSGYDGPAAGMSAATLANIYDCTYKTWDQVPGAPAGSAGKPIHALLPPASSGTATFFLQDLAAAKPGFAVGSTCGIRTVQEHDPTGIYADNSAADAIEPFSAGKLTLINNGYFANGVAYTGTGAANGAYTPNYLKLDSGSSAYSSVRGLYFAVRQSDVGNQTPFQDGSTANFVTTLFTDSQSAIRSGNGTAQIAAAGFTPAYKDCGINVSSC